MRASTEQHRRDLKFATYRLIDLVGAGNLVSVTRVKAPALSKYAALHEEEHFAPLDVVLDAERASGSRIVTEAMARMHGMTLTPVEAGEAGAKDLRDHMETMEDDFARLRLAVRDATSDGNVDANERRDIRRRLDALKRAIDDLEGLI